MDGGNLSMESEKEKFKNAVVKIDVTPE